MYFSKYLYLLHQITGEGFPVLNRITAYLVFVVDKFRKAGKPPLLYHIHFIIEGRSLHFLYHPAKGVDFPEPCVALQWKRQLIVFNFDFLLTLNPKTFPDFFKIHGAGKPCPRIFLKILMVKPCGVQDVDSHFLNQYHVLSLSGFWGVTLPKPLVDFRHEAIRACSITEV